MPHAPTVSVIVPTYNRRDWVCEAVDSVLAQTFRDFELIVVDDGSTDGTCQLLGRYAGRLAYVYLRRGGVSRARNVGFGLSRGPLVAFLDSDDLWKPKKLLRQVECLREHPECPLCHTDEIWIRRGARVNQGKKHRKYGGSIFEHCLPLCVISPSSVMMRRELLQETGGFDESFPVCEDYELWLRVCARYPVAFLTEPLIVKRGGHADQLSRSTWAIDRYRVAALRKSLESGTLARRQWEAAREELLRKCRILELGFEKHNRPEELRAVRQLMFQYADPASEVSAGPSEE